MKVHYGWCVFEPEEIGGSEFMDTVDRFGCMVPIEYDDGKIPLLLLKNVVNILFVHAVQIIVLNFKLI